ncbi:MAG: RluA family pseudouridine synthase [Desulfuromonas sp.]|nr:MAG: RluA family pseudouridine synthase [Desulfuromonas sp.]
MGSRLDLFIAAAGSEISRSLAKKVIDLGGVHLNGRRVRSCSTTVRPGDSVEVYLDHLPLDPYRIQPEEILFQDKYLIVLNKPALVETQPTHARFKGTLYEALLWYLRNPFRPRLKPEVGMIQRLDRGTSGVILFSIHQRAHKELTRIFLEHCVEKRYLALVHDCPPEEQGEIRSLLARSRNENRVCSVARGGKEAITRYRVVERFPAAALVELELITGRSHQIRAHMSELGCPLLGDVLYGGQDSVAGVNLARPMLHSHRLAFSHPVLNQALEFFAPVPEDMIVLRTKLGEMCV